MPSRQQKLLGPRKLSEPEAADTEPTENSADRSGEMESQCCHHRARNAQCSNTAKDAQKQEYTVPAATKTACSSGESADNAADDHDTNCQSHEQQPVAES